MYLLVFNIFDIFKFCFFIGIRMGERGWEGLFWFIGKYVEIDIGFLIWEIRSINKNINLGYRINESKIVVFIWSIIIKYNMGFII